jgi:hypothetical protein
MRNGLANDEALRFARAARGRPKRRHGVVVERKREFAYARVGHDHRYSQRAWSDVADVHRALVEGGTYFYPPDRTHPDGKLRLLYEDFVKTSEGGTSCRSD